MATIKRTGFGQLELNHVSAQRTGQIYAQLPVDSSITVLENGQFAKYDYATGKVNFTGAGEFMLVANEVKVYDERETNKDFALLASETVGEMVPRLFKTNIGDIFTTNCVGEANTKGADYAGIDIVVGDMLEPSATGYLVKTADETAADMLWEVAKVYTLGDGQIAIKVMRVK